jgi:hypothetical protein
VKEMTRQMQRALPAKVIEHCGSTQPLHHLVRAKASIELECRHSESITPCAVGQRRSVAILIDHIARALTGLIIAKAGYSSVTPTDMAITNGYFFQPMHGARHPILL